MSARGQCLGLFATDIPFEEAKMRRQFGAIDNNFVARYGAGSDYQLLRWMSLLLTDISRPGSNFRFWG
jgi:hypothetical protein